MGVRRAIDDVRHGEPVMDHREGDRFKLSYRAGTGWTLALRLKPIGESAYWELASDVQQGLWTDVGVVEPKTAAMKIARSFLEGEKAWREAYCTNIGTLAAAIIDSKSAHAELVRGEAPRGSYG